MLCVEARDKEKPQTCIAPELTYPLKLEGVYEIWVGTYQPLFGGGIDIKLSRDKVFGTVDPQEVAIRQWPLPPAQYGTLVQVLLTTTDLTGQQIQIRQPHGTYQSLWWGLCNAHLAYIRLVRRDPAELKQQEAARNSLARKGVILDRDGFSYVWNWGTDRIDCILQQVEQCGQGNVEALNWCIGGSLETNFPHPMTKSRILTTERLGDRRATKVYRDFESRGIDVLKELSARCHELGIKIYASHRANVRYHPSDIWDAHPDWHLANQGGLDYAKPAAQLLSRFSPLHRRKMGRRRPDHRLLPPSPPFQRRPSPGGAVSPHESISARSAGRIGPHCQDQEAAAGTECVIYHRHLV